MPLLLVLLACTGKEPVDDSAPLPLFAIVEPAEGSTVGRCFTAVARTNGVTLVDPTTHPSNADGEGHWHILLDQRYFVCEAEACDVRIEDVEPGPFTLVGQLVENDYTPWLDEDGAEVKHEVPLTLTDGGCDTET